MTLNHKSIEEAYNLINKKIIKTPLVSNDYINNLLNVSDLLEKENMPSIKEQEKKLEDMKKNRESMGSVNLRADIETENFKATIKKIRIVGRGTFYCPRCQKK